MKYEKIDSGYLRMTYGRPEFQEREQEAYDFLEANTDLVQLWDNSPETAWCDIFEHNGQLLVMAGDTEIMADGTFYVVPFNE